MTDDPNQTIRDVLALHYAHSSRDLGARQAADMAILEADPATLRRMVCHAVGIINACAILAPDVIEPALAKLALTAAQPDGEQT